MRAAALALLAACGAAQAPVRPAPPVIVRHVDPAHWSAGVAAAAIVAASALDRAVGELALPDGVSDDLGVAGVTAARIVAATTGKPPQAVQAGTIYPDGSLGPAPVGELAGMSLPAPVAETEMALEPATAQALEARYRQWQQKVATEWAELIQLDSAGRLPPLLATLRDAARAHADEAERMHRQGQIAAAYSRMLAAWAYATSTTRTYAVLSKVQAGDLAGAGDVIGSSPSAVGEVLHRIGLAQPTTLAGDIAQVAAFRSALEAWVFDQLAERAIASSHDLLDTLKTRSAAELGSPAIADQVVDTIAPALVESARRDAGSALAEEELALAPDTGPPHTVALAEVRRIASTYRAAGSALLGTAPPADSDALIATAMVHLDETEGLPQQLRAEWGEDSRPWALLSLAAGELAYLDAATPLARASLGAHTDAHGKVDTLSHEDALAPLVAAADRHARASARAARDAAGTIPIQVLLAYQLAAAEKSGSVDDRIDALSELWTAFVITRVTARLAR